MIGTDNKNTDILISGYLHFSLLKVCAKQKGAVFGADSSMERQKYISLVVELRQIAVAKALTLLDDHDTAEDVAGEVLLRLWEGHRDLHDDADKVKHLANLMARNLSLNLLRQRRRHPIMRIFHRREKDDDESFNMPDVPEPFTPQQYVEDKETNDVVLRAMSQLPYNWRKIVGAWNY